METMTIGGGCFWCTEAVFDRVKGVENVVPGYSGGTVPGTPTYREVCSGLTGHAEVIQVTFDPQEISFRELLEIFFVTHDPTTLNRQGADVGTQYRSVVFYNSGNQKKIAEEVRNEMMEVYDNTIVTEIKPLTNFFPAEKEHLDYYTRNPEQAYCQAVISPKVAKFKKLFAEKVK